ncbi:hypothetical protein KSC_093930 [Ktedonobacter sp. SOSP1-52]|nr:hypothetical protein KSC_093930 [Ktedonobacter sp. SOSP1-52]
MLAPLGCAQEEEIKRICEAELELWRRRPSLKRASSLQKPLTETRHRIRETFPLTQENCWCNPKSGQKEHLSLKYLNFSTQEWRQMAAASEREVQERREHPLPLARPWELIGKVEHLLQSNVWPQLVVGIGLATGRGLVEILHTGHFTKKSAYSLLVAAPMTVYEVMSDPFEVPTLVEASQVLAAVHRVRQFFGNHFQGLRRRDVSQQCLSHIQEAAYKQVGNLVPLRPLARNMYTSLAHGVYPRLAAWLYCPLTVDTWYYAATIQHHQKFLEATSAEERSTLAQMALYDEYVVLDEHGSIDERRGIRLGEPGVEVLEVFKQTDGRVHGVPQEKRARAQEEMQRDDGQEREDGKGRAQRDRERRSQVRAGEKEGKTLALQWLEARWHWLIAEMAEYVVDEGGGDEEEEIWAICEAEMAQWRAYCRQNQSMSYQEMMMRTRLVLRTCLPAPWNERWNEEAGEWEHIGLKYLRCREDEWEQMRQDWQDRRVLLPDPELIVARAKGLLSRGVMEAEAWPDLVVGIAVLTGQGLMAILKNGSFSQKTAYSLLFRDAVHDNPFFPGPFAHPDARASGPRRRSLGAGERTCRWYPGR